MFRKILTLSLFSLLIFAACEKPNSKDNDVEVDFSGIGDYVESDEDNDSENDEEEVDEDEEEDLDSMSPLEVHDSYVDLMDEYLDVFETFQDEYINIQDGDSTENLKNFYQDLKDQNDQVEEFLNQVEFNKLQSDLEDVNKNELLPAFDSFEDEFDQFTEGQGDTYDGSVITDDYAALDAAIDEVADVYNDIYYEVEAIRFSY